MNIHEYQAKSVLAKFGVALAMCVWLSACESAVQTTSGKEYLERQVASGALHAGSGDIEDVLKKVASVEPTLTFPARIGLARVARARQFNEKMALTAIPDAEAAAWNTVREHLGANYGEFVPLSPMVATMAMQSVGGKDEEFRNDVMNQIRVGAARQHLDAVLVYEVIAKSEKSKNILAIGDLTIIGGYLLPSESLQADAYSAAMLIDVMQGYPYGTVHTTLEHQEALSSRWGWGSSKEDFEKETSAKVVTKLSGEVETMMKNLRTKLSEKKNKQ